MEWLKACYSRVGSLCLFEWVVVDEKGDRPAQVVVYFACCVKRLPCFYCVGNVCQSKILWSAIFAAEISRHVDNFCSYI